MLAMSLQSAGMTTRPLAFFNAGGPAHSSARPHWLQFTCAMTDGDDAALIKRAADSCDVDADEIAAALGGDGDAYRRLMQRYQPAIVLQMRRFSRDPAIIEELVHDVFVEAYYSLRTYRGSSPWLHWLRRVAVRVGYRFWQRKRTTQTAEVFLSDEDWQRLHGKLPCPANSTEAAEMVDSLLAQLRPNDRLILTLLYLDACTIAEAASRAGWTVVGTRVRAFRARNRLRKLIERGRR